MAPRLEIVCGRFEMAQRREMLCGCFEMVPRPEMVCGRVEMGGVARWLAPSQDGVGAVLQ